MIEVDLENMQGCCRGITWVAKASLGRALWII